MSTKINLLNTCDLFARRRHLKKKLENQKKTNPKKFRKGHYTTRDEVKPKIKPRKMNDHIITNENDHNELNRTTKNNLDGSLLPKFVEIFLEHKNINEEEGNKIKKERKISMLYDELNTQEDDVNIQEYEEFEDYDEDKLKEAQKTLELDDTKELSKIRIYSKNLENLNINMELQEKNSFNKEQYKEILSKFIMDDYLNSIVLSLLKGEQAVSNFLVHSEITERMRMRMVDWMIEVLSSYHCEDETFFESVNIMDRYFSVCEKKNQILKPDDLHLIGVTSMFIASKYHDIYPLRLQLVYEKISHKKLSVKEIKDKEIEIMDYLEFNLGMPNVWDFTCLYIEQIFYTNFNKHQIDNQILLDNYYKDSETEEDKILGNKLNKLYTKNMLILLKYVCIYLAKMNCHDINLMKETPSLLAAGTVFVALKISEQINNETYVNDYFTKKLKEVSHQSINNIIKISQMILNNAQTFDDKFSGLENLKKVHFNAIIDLKNTK